MGLEKRQGGQLRRILQEMIGRVTKTNLTARPATRTPTRVSVDWTQVDYAFWGRLRRGQQKGYELGGLFAQPLADILTGWVLGEGVKAELTSPPGGLSEIGEVKESIQVG